MRGQRAFTLVEILVAVMILAIALAATTRAASIATDGSFETRARLLATWAAENRVAEIRARAIFPGTGTTSLDATEGDTTFTIDQVVTDTANPAIRKVELAVSDSRDPQRVLTRLVAYVSP
ncbi:MAG TPA: type II secretion system minor pseudopilin GspI [Usitatibacter sp.]|nr:type II secretion system minor pseudopilin GspI [Usitatibacter sp.]